MVAKRSKKRPRTRSVEREELEGGDDPDQPQEGGHGVEASASAAASNSASSAAGDAPAPSALEELHPDVLEAILQQLGFLEASRLRAVSAKFREAVDRVAEWRFLRVKLDTAVQIRRVAAAVRKLAGLSSRPAAAQSINAGARRCRRRVGRTRTLAGSAAVEVEMPIDQVLTGKQRQSRAKAVGAFFAACSASSGGVGSISVTMTVAEAPGLSLHEQAFRLMTVPADCDELLEAALGPLSAPEADGGSSRSLKRVVVRDVDQRLARAPLPEGLVKPLSLLKRVEHLELPYSLDGALPALAAALPALRSAVVGGGFHDGAALAALAPHPALRELALLTRGDRDFSRGFKEFAAGPAARRLRKLRISFGRGHGDRRVVSANFDVAELPCLARLAALETLELALVGYDRARFGADVRVFTQTLAGLEKLRSLDLRLWSPLDADDLQDVARAIDGLCAHSLGTLRLTLVGMGSETNEALAGLLRKAAPALVELDTGREALLGEAAQALAACPRLRRLSLAQSTYEEPPVRLAAAVDALAACPRLKEIYGLDLYINSVQDASEGLEPLRRLAEARGLGSGACCSFFFRPGMLLRPDVKDRAVEAAGERLRAILPEARAAWASHPFAGPH